jgi:hypothetical protein
MSDFNFNPSYSVIKSINFASTDGSVDALNIIRQNTECVFERIEFVENVNDVFPNGVLIVKDTKDIITAINTNKFSSLIIEFFDSSAPVWGVDITSVSYLNNAASDTEENFVGIYFTNKYYIKSQTTSLNELLAIKKPNVYRIEDFVSILRTDVLGSLGLEGEYTDDTTNYILYKPLNTLPNRTEAVSDNAIEYLNYITTSAISTDTNLPTFMFWTDFSGAVNFKAFKYDISSEPIEHYFAIFEGDAVEQRLTGDDQFYKKIYFYNTEPAAQYISKNYYYVRKTPKVLDEIPAGLCASANSSGNSLTSQLDEYITKTLMYQFHDEGQRYNLEIVGSSGTNFSTPGAEQLVYPHHWGYYDNLDSIDHFTSTTLLGQNFGTSKFFESMNFMGASGYMPFVDNTQMWKNMFDMTTVHPDFPNTTGYPLGTSTNLQKVLDIRYNNFIDGVSGEQNNLEFLRKLEMQNFVLYSLCCMGTNPDDCFFAVLKKYEVDCTKGYTGADQKAYRYMWNKIDFDATGLCGGKGADGCFSGACGACGGTYFHHMENWSLSTIKSSDTQDNSWAINLNERGITNSYLPPGWVPDCIPTGFNYRPIGAKGIDAGSCGDIYHIVKLCKHTEGNNYFYYFTAENVVDGCCDIP